MSIYSYKTEIMGLKTILCFDSFLLGEGIVQQFLSHLDISDYEIKLDFDYDYLIHITDSDNAIISKDYDTITDSDVEKYCENLLYNKQNRNFYIKLYKNILMEEKLCNAFRFIRKIIEVELCNRFIFIHSGVLEFNNVGFGIIGDKGAGKTTTIFNLLTYFKCNFISNDKVFISWEEKTNQMKVFSLPYSMGIGYGTLIKYASSLQVNKLMENIDDLQQFSDINMNLDKECKKYFSVKYVESIFNTKVVNHCKLQFFIKPVYNQKKQRPSVCAQRVKWDSILEKNRILCDKKHLPSIGNLLFQRKQLTCLKDNISSNEICLLTVQYNETNAKETMDLIQEFITNKDYM